MTTILLNNFSFHRLSIFVVKLFLFFLGPIWICFIKTFLWFSQSIFLWFEEPQPSKIILLSCFLVNSFDSCRVCILASSRGKKWINIIESLIHFRYILNNNWLLIELPISGYCKKKILHCAFLASVSSVLCQDFWGSSLTYCIVFSAFLILFTWLDLAS